MTQLYGLIGKTLKHSFSQKYFREKFKKENISNSDYLLFELESIKQFPSLLADNPGLCGINVTIPYKLEVMQFLDQIDDIAKEIGAVNTIKISNNKTIGYNTDYLGFMQSLHDWMSPFPSHLKALILGTGGASKAVAAALKDLQIPYRYVARRPDELGFSYQNLQEKKTILQEHQLIINTTPLGTSPNINEAPSIPYETLSNRHFLYDLVYNPAETLFLKLGKDKGARTKNGLEMLELQAEKAWEIWNS